MQLRRIIRDEKEILQYLDISRDTWTDVPLVEDKKECKKIEFYAEVDCLGIPLSFGSTPMNNKWKKFSESPLVEEEIKPKKLREFWIAIGQSGACVDCSDEPYSDSYLGYNGTKAIIKSIELPPGSAVVSYDDLEKAIVNVGFITSILREMYTEAISSKLGITKNES